jgi:hypothetical protein
MLNVCHWVSGGCTLRRLIALLAITFLVPAYAARPSLLPTPIGPRAADYFERFQILDVRSFRDVENTGRGPHEGLQYIPIALPPGTEFIVPVLQGWRLVMEPTGSGDTRYGFGVIALFPEDWDLPDRPDVREPQLAYSGGLFNSSGRNRFSAFADYSLMFLRRMDRPLVPIAGPAPQPLELFKLTGEFARGGGLADARSPYTESGSVSLPAPATHAISAFQGFVIGFGRHESPIAPAVEAPRRPSTNRPFKEASVRTRIGEIDPVRGASTVTFTADHLLKDRNGDDPWFVGSDFSVLAFAPQPQLDSAGVASVEIAGFLNRVTRLNGSPGEGLLTDVFEVDVPADTDDVIPLVRGWALGYGDLVQDPNTATIIWDRTEQNFGVGQVGVFVRGLREGPTPLFKRATLVVSIGLRDRGVNDAWFGNIAYTLLCVREKRR